VQQIESYFRNKPADIFLCIFVIQCETWYLKVFPFDCFERFLWKEMSQNKQKNWPKPREKKKVEVSYSIVTCIWLSLCSCPRRLPACEGANSDLVYRDHMARKQGLKDAAPRTRFDEFPMIRARVYSFLSWNRHPVAHAPDRGWAAERVI